MNVPPNETPGIWSPTAALDNERLVEAIAKGDRNAEHAFAMRYLRPVRAMLLARTRNPDLVGDLAQDALLEALCALRRGQIREPRKLTSFVIGIASNVLNNYFRNVSRRLEPLELPDDLPDLSSSSAQLEDRQREAIAMTAIASLDPVDKTILEMTLVDGLKPGVIAQKLGLNSDVVRQRKLRATRRVIDFVSRQSQSDAPNHMFTGHRP
jgi:RNA polymerase sigma-70 factor (ECF subfamily)